MPPLSTCVKVLTALPLDRVRAVAAALLFSNDLDEDVATFDEQEWMLQCVINADGVAGMVRCRVRVLFLCVHTTSCPFVLSSALNTAASRGCLNDDCL